MAPESTEEHQKLETLGAVQDTAEPSAEGKAVCTAAEETAEVKIRQQSTHMAVAGKKIGQASASAQELPMPRHLKAGSRVAGALLLREHCNFASNLPVRPQLCLQIAVLPQLRVSATNVTCRMLLNDCVLAPFVALAKLGPLL